MAQRNRRHIELDSGLNERLKRLSAATGESEASLIRRGIEWIVAQRGQAHIHYPRDPVAGRRRMTRDMEESKLEAPIGEKIFNREDCYDRVKRYEQL